MNFYVMQVRAAVLALAVCLGGSALAWGGEAAAPDVPKLVEALKSDDPDERDKAYRTLAEAGEPVRADLEKALAGAENNPDLASRLRNLLKNIGQREMLAGFDAPKTIDLELAEGTLGEAMAKLKAAFGWDVKCNEAAAAKKLSVTLKGARFFEALEALRKAAGVTYRVNQNSLWGGDNNKKGELPLELVDKGEDDWLTAAAAGPFLILPMSVNYQEYRTKSIFPGQANQRNFSFQGVVLAEPGCAASAVAPGKCSFTDAKGKDFASAYGDNNRGFGGHGDGGRNGVFQFNDQFQISDELSGPVNWKCMLKVQVPLKMKSKRIESLADLKVPEKNRPPRRRDPDSRAGSVRRPIHAEVRAPGEFGQRPDEFPRRGFRGHGGRESQAAGEPGRRLRSRRSRRRAPEPWHDRQRRRGENGIHPDLSQETRRGPDPMAQREGRAELRG
ncbi:MAG: hypothetical protein M5U26_22035 [Planctomycetota bacterium]|nr:hypothetical protein [Planctomycetota bacterium]